MESPEVYQLTRIRWQLFGTLTFTSERLPERVRLAMWFSVARKTAETFRLYFPTLLWCLRQEEGELTARKHFHVLLGGLPSNKVTIATCFQLMAGWELTGGGMARVRLFDRSLNGVDYVSKCLSISGSDAYESAKFGSKSSGLMLSKGAEKILRRIIGEERRHVEQQEQRRDTKVVESSDKSHGLKVAKVSPFGTRRERIQATEVLRQKWAKTLDLPGTLRSVPV